MATKGVGDSLGNEDEEKNFTKNIETSSSHLC